MFYIVALQQTAKSFYYLLLQQNWYQNLNLVLGYILEVVFLKIPKLACV